MLCGGCIEYLMDMKLIAEPLWFFYAFETR